MLHLHTDRLAALADEAPSPDEAAHLALCAECARELRAHEALRAMSSVEGSGGGHLAMPLTRWDALSAELRREGLIVTPARISGPTAVPARRTMPVWIVRAAAAVLLVAGGAVAGRLTAPQAEPAAETLAQTDKPLVTPKPKDKPTPIERAAPVPEASEASFVANIPSSFESVNEARLWQQRLEVAYQNAAAFIAANDTTGVNEIVDGRGVHARLAALDAAGDVMREALREAPADPVINGYYLTTLGQREATLRQMNAVSPAGQRVIGF
jgi:hypothetical protein